MAKELSLEEFMAVFGMSPEEYQSNKKPVQTGDTKQKAETAFMQRMSDSINTQKIKQAAEPQFKTAKRRYYEKAGIKMSPAEEIFDAMNAPVDKVASNLAAGVLSTPSSVGGAVDLVRFGAPAVVDGVMSGKSDSTLTNIADEFMTRVIPKESMDRLERAQIEAVDKFKKQNPNAGQKDVAKFAEWYTGSDDFYKRTLEELPVGLRMAQKGQNWANDVAGTGKRADQMSAGEEAMQIVGSAGVGLPASTMNKITRPLVKMVGKKVADNLAVKLAARTVEALTPATLPLNPTNIAINSGVGVALNETVRGMQGQETLVDYANLYDPEKTPEPETLIGATGLAAGMFLGVPSISNVIKKQAAANATKSIKNIGQSAGPSLQAQSSEMTPKLSKFTGLADENAPLKKAANMYKSANDTETVPMLDALRSAASPINIIENENNALNYGILDGIGRNTVPFAEVNAVYQRLDDVSKDTFDKYVYAVQRKQDSTVYEKSLVRQVSQARADFNAAQMRGSKADMAKTQQKLVEMQQKYTAYQQDAPTSRSSMINWSRQDVDGFIKAGEANPAVKKVADAVRQMSKDLVEFEHKNGIIDADEALRRTRARDLYVPLQERAHPDATGLKRRALLFGDKIKATWNGSDPEQGMFINTSARNVTGEGATVNNPKTAIVSLQEGIMHAVRDVSANNARRNIIDTLDALPKARGNILRPYEFDIGNGRITRSISQAQYHTLFPRGIKNEDNYIKVFRDGKIELWEFSDKSITRSLKFAPLSAVPIMNASRKLYQTTTTGLAAPWFTAKTFLWDAPLAQTTKNAGRSLGLIDTYARKLAMGTPLETPVGAVLDRVFDPTIHVAAAAAIPYQLGLRAARAVGVKVATDLASNSGLFNVLAKSGPRGKAFVDGVGTFMVTAFDRSALGVMSRNMSTSLSHLNDVTKIADDYAKAAKRSTGPIRTAFESYKAVVESIHMSTRTAFFASNYGRLKSQYKGKIPDAELKKLVQETRNLTGDMSRQSNSPTIQRINSVIPYGNAIIQGTRHILTSAIPQDAAKLVNTVGGNVLTDRNTRFWSQFTTGILLPSLGAASVLSQWEGAEEYWYLRTPKWKQMTTIPLPNVEAIEHLMTHGEFPPFDPKYVNAVPIAPEFSLILEPVKAGLRAMGMSGPAVSKVPAQFSNNLKDVLNQLTSFSTPPVVSAIFAVNGKRVDLHGMMTGQGGIQDANPIPAGGANADMHTNNSDMSQVVYDTLGALSGAAAQLVAETWNVADITYEETNSFWTAAESALDTASFEVKRRLPEIDVPAIFDARTRLYQSTPESEYVYQTQNDLEPIIGSGRQVSVERDTEGNIARQEALAMEAAKKIRDPNLRSMSVAVYAQIKQKGDYKAAQENAATIRKDLAALEASRFKIPDDKYNEKRNQLTKLIQDQTHIQARVLQGMEKQIQKQVGRRFIQQYGVPFSYKALSDLVRKDVAR